MDHVMDKDVWATVGDKRGAKRLEQVCNSHRALGESVVCVDLDELEEIMTEVLDELYSSERSRKNYVRRCEELEAELYGGKMPATVSVVLGGGTGFDPCAVFTDKAHAEAYATALESGGRWYWVESGVVVNPKCPDSWAAVERDATTSPASYCHAHGIDRDAEWQDMSEGIEAMTRGLVARCKRLAGVE